MVAGNEKKFLLAKLRWFSLHFYLPNFGKKPYIHQGKYRCIRKLLA